LVILVSMAGAWAGSGREQPGKALREALEDERKARATYEAILDRLGDETRPFRNIVRAEQRHEDHLLPLFEKYGVSVPDDPWKSAEIEVPATRAEACREAVEAERKNGALYDALIEAVEQDDVRETFEMLRDRSVERHLPAFERCAAGGGKGQGRGSGKELGHGKRAGKGRQHRGGDVDTGFGCSRGGGHKGGCCGSCG
jgi:rubrerythrin